MPLERLHLKNFRLFQDKVFKISEGTTLILGKNGSGKTSILESVNILIAGKSFRTKETKDCIKSEKEFFSISAKDLSFVSLENKYVLESGDFTVHVGGSSKDLTSLNFFVR